MSDQVIAQMKENIEKGIWKPKERLPGELQLCEIFGTSRVTVRNALQKLAGEGLIETRVGDGSYVRKYSANCWNSAVSWKAPCASWQSPV